MTDPNVPNPRPITGWNFTRDEVKIMEKLLRRESGISLQQAMLIGRMEERGLVYVHRNGVAVEIGLTTTGLTAYNDTRRDHPEFVAKDLWPLDLRTTPRKRQEGKTK